MIGRVIERAPVQALFFGGMLGGAALGLTSVTGMHEDAAGRVPRGVLHLGAATVLTGAGLLGAMSLERTVGPYASRYTVDGLERVSRVTINLNWASRSAHWGALTCGVGLGLMQTFPLAF